MMRNFALALALATIPASATTRAERLMLEDREPLLAFTTARDVQDASDCLHAALFAVHPAVEQIPQPSGRVIRVTNLGNTQVIVRVTPVDGGSHVDYRARFKAGAGKFTAAVKRCQ